MKRKLLLLLYLFFCFVAFGQGISITTTSNSATWSPFRVTKSGAELLWTASGSSLSGSPVSINTNDPTFDFSSNDGSPINITVTSVDGFSGLTELDLWVVPDGGNVTNLDISDATALTNLNTRYNQLTSLDLSQNSVLTSLTVRGNYQFPSGILDISNNPLLTLIQGDVTRIANISVANNPLLTIVYLFDAQLTTATMDQMIIDLDNNNLSNGELRISGNPGVLTFNSYNAYNNLISKGWTIDVPAPPSTPLPPNNEKITITTTSNSPAWSPFRVIKSGSGLLWTASGSSLSGSPVSINTNDPTFDFSSNDGSPINITVTSVDGFSGLTELDLWVVPDGGNVTNLDISDATALTNLNTRYNQLTSLDLSQNSVLTSLTVRGNNQFPSGILDISNNPLLTLIQGDVTRIANISVANNPLLTIVYLFDAQLTTATMDQIIIDLDNHNLSNGELRISGNPGALTFNSLIAYNNLVAKGWTIDVPAPAAAPGPEINVVGNGLSIPSGNVAIIEDGTDFGQVPIGSPITKTYTIQNIGDSNLNVSTLGLFPSPGGGVGFTLVPIIGGFPPTAPVIIPSGGVLDIEVTFNPLLVGVQNTLVGIVSNDPNEPNYFLNLTAEGVAASNGEIEVRGNNTVIANGDVTPSLTDDTDFGLVVQNTTETKTYTINNIGTSPLTVSSISLFPSTVFTFGGASQTLPFNVPVGGSITFDVNFTPTGLVGSQAIVNINNSQSVNSPYQFLVAGTGVDAPDIQEIMISQYYDGFNGSDKWIEVKNISNQAIPAGKYYLALYDQSQSLTGVPTQNQVIPAMIAGEVVLFKNANAVIPAAGNLGQAGTSSPVCSFDNGDDIIIISLSNGTNSFGNRVDMIGRQVTWGRNTTYIKGGCASESAHRDFQESYWVRIAVEDINTANPLTNLAMGTQAIGPTSPTSIDVTSWSNGPSDRTRNVIINTLINPVSIVACDLTVASGLTLNYGGGTTATLDLYGDLITAGAGLIIGDTESLLTREPNASLGAITKLEKSNTLFNLHDNTYWSSPISSATIQGTFPGVNPDRIFEYRAGDPNPIYDYPGSPYLNYKYWWNKGSGDMAVGYGYAAEGPNSPVAANDYYITPFQHEISFTGIPNNGNQIIDVFYKTTEDVGLENGNFNLLGNPYPTAINIEAFLGNNANVYQIALWTHANPISGGSGGNFSNDYVYYNEGGSNSPFVTTNIGSSQGFMVRTTGSGGQVTFSNVFKLANANNQFFKPEISKKELPVIDGQNDRIWLRMHDGSVKSDILVGFFEKATDGVDERYDAIGISTDKNINLYSLIDKKNYTIQGLGSFSPEKSIPLGFNIKEAKDLSLSISGLEGVFVDSDVYLVDHALNKTHNLKEGDYKFNQTTRGDFPNRFTLQFSKNVVDVDKIIEGSEFNVFNSGEGFRINASKVVKEVRVYDMLGRTIINSKPEQQSFYLNAGNLKTGAVLIFEVKLDNGSILNKKAIKM